MSESESKKREKYLIVYFVYGNESNYSKVNREKELENLGIELKLEKTALTAFVIPLKVNSLFSKFPPTLCPLQLSNMEVAKKRKNVLVPIAKYF